MRLGYGGVLWLNEQRALPAIKAYDKRAFQWTWRRVDMSFSIDIVNQVGL